MLIGPDFEARIRPQQPTDRPFLRSSWISVCWDQERWLGSKGCSWTERPTWRAGMERRVDRLLSSCLVLVLEPVDETEDTEQIMGYVVRETERPVVHMLLTKRWCRGWGGGRALYRAAVPNGESMSYTQRTAAGARLAAHWGLKYNPFSLEE